MAVLFADIRGFTSLTESLADAPERLTALLNRYFTAMTEVILGHEGTIDKYIGDAIMAEFGIPVTRGDDPDRAVRRVAVGPPRGRTRVPSGPRLP
mgnify:CR=1 FL=1